MTASRATLPDALPANLRCPECTSAFHFVPSPSQPLADGTFGVLSCGEHTFPVIDSIPVLRSGRIDVQDHLTGRADVAGPSVEELLYRVRVDPLEALVTLLAFPPSLPFDLERRPGLRLPLTKGPVARLTAHKRRRLVRGMLRRLGEQCAQDWLDLSYLRSRNVDRELHPYFLNRFGQPRYLASLSLTSILEEDPLPVLDVACGFGHVMHHLAIRSRPLSTIGVDRNFFQLWVARRFIVPGGHYVCADVSRPLPFTDDSFSASLCTDAFHLLDDKQTCFDEMRRCARDRTVVVDRVGNQMVEPHDGERELDPTGYVGLARDTPWRMVSQTELVEGYLRCHGPQLARQRDVDEFSEQKWLSLVITDNTALFRDYGRFERMPHSEGPLGINPIYRTMSSPDGLRLVFEFPSTWYAFENAESLSYHATAIRLTADEFETVHSGKRTARTDELVEKYVLVGMPQRYTRPPVPEQAS
ncbi:class I SAM-dependent methyltransferase [Kibdelosporangium persicum]|uniref:Methyltransferase family protein n=1 Tax=Kibdelosporangium persicum TaxID=2698649 RepID=A0ABX2FCT1_9PSEU|nr:class I SAM-dependent methyltransferase [Kibdelosporangium persicum]NRN69173.1 Methyltransferase family protein [Kibdelosporangium persicum]